MTKLNVKSPAKINLVLDLIGKRSDGYHEVQFLMQELELHDLLEFSIRDDDRIVLSCDEPAIFCDQRNLILKAGNLLQQITGCKKGANIHLNKRIPMVGGLGGSSSNAAHSLIALNRLWQTSLGQTELLNLAVRIGMDCAFFFFGGTCIARGRGEIIEPIAAPPQFNVVVISPDVKVPENKTQWIYGNFSLSRVNAHPSVERAVEVLKSSSSDLANLVSTFGNVFEQGLAIEEYKVVWKLLEQLRAEPEVLGAYLAGAGPSVFAVTRDLSGAKKIEASYRRRHPLAFRTVAGLSQNELKA